MYKLPDCEIFLRYTFSMSAPDPLDIPVISPLDCLADEPPPLSSTRLSSSEVESLVAKDRMRMLSWGYYLQGVVGILTCSIFIIHFLMFLVMGNMPDRQFESTFRGESSTHSNMDPGAYSSDELAKKAEDFKVMQTFMRWGAVGVGVLILAGWVFGGLTIFAGKCLARGKRKLFVQIMAGLNCIFLPYGTALGAATFLLLTTPGAKRQFVNFS